MRQSCTVTSLPPGQPFLRASIFSPGGRLLCGGFPQVAVHTWHLALGHALAALLAPAFRLDDTGWLRTSTPLAGVYSESPGGAPCTASTSVGKLPQSQCWAPTFVEAGTPAPLHTWPSVRADGVHSSVQGLPAFYRLLPVHD